MPKHVWCVFALLAAAGLACSLGTPKATPTAVPTATSAPTLPPPTAVPTPTLAPSSTPTAISSPTPQPTETPQAVLGKTLYEHPKGLFTFHPPQGWKLDNEDEAFVIYIQPEAPAVTMLVVSAINTGYALDAQGFTGLVAAYEQPFQMEGGYQELQSLLKNSAALMPKTYYCGSEKCYTISYYEQVDNVVLIIDITVPAKRSEMGDALLDAVVSDLRYNSEAISDQPIYNDWWTFNADYDYFTMQVPLAWYYAYTTTDDLIIDRFTAPDAKAFIESIIYDDGTAFDKSDIGKIALGYLRDAYAEDLKVTDDQVQSDGSERLFWHSANNHLTGITFFERRGDTTILILTLASNDDVWETYIDLFDRILTSYDIP